MKDRMELTKARIALEHAYEVEYQIKLMWDSNQATTADYANALMDLWEAILLVDTLEGEQ